MIEARFRQVLAEMSVISDKTASALGGGSPSADPDWKPRGPNLTLGDEFAARWLKANGPTARRAVLEDAERELELARRAAPRPAERFPGTLEWRLAIVADERPVVVVAQEFGISVGYVYELRRRSKAMKGAA